MFFTVCSRRSRFSFFLAKWMFSLGLVVVLQIFLNLNLSAQPFNQTQYYQQPSTNYLQKSQAFRQEIARFEITVQREGRMPLSLSQVPRVQEGDVIKVKLLDEPVNGIKLDQSLYDWTLLVAFINPNRKFVDGERKSKEVNQSSVSEEIQFRKKGWYREHSFTVPYDSQPVFFLYPRPNYRSKILGLVNKNYNEIRKLGEKTIDLAGAYAQIGMFLNELQGVLSGNGYYGNNGYGSYGNSGSYGTYNNSYNSYNNYNRYGYNNYGYNQAYNYNLLVSQSVERLARSFNIQLPQNCWQGSSVYLNNNSYGYGLNQPAINPEMINRLQCVAKNVRLEDFDLSVSRLLQQGGILLAAQLQQKYPQIAHWINIAALAVDFIVKVFKKTAMRIVPTVTSSSDNLDSNRGYGVSGVGNYNNQYNSAYSSTTPNAQSPPPVKISLFAENQPDDNQFVTAYPLILHKWQAEPDAEIISLRPPVLMEPCLHAGVNVLKSTDLTEDQLSDNFTKNYTLTMTSTNGFKKEFPLKKNIGLNGWELNITPQDLQEFPKIQMNLETTIKGTRGFNEIKSPPFYLPIAIGGSWQITPESQQNFTVGGRRTITIKNTLGNCQCLQAVIYKPSFGGQFVFEADSVGSGSNSNDQNSLQYSPDGKEVSFEVDAANFQAGQGEIELRTYGGESHKIPLKLYPLPPNVTNLKIGKGDREAIISGERLEQIQAVKVNGRRATVIGSQSFQSGQSSQSYQNPNQQNYGNQPSYPSSPNSATLNSANSVTVNYTPNLQTNSPNERVIVFEDANAKITENTANLELSLEDNRTLQVKQTFPVSASRPTIVSNEAKEIEGTPISIDSGKLIMDNASGKPQRQPHQVNQGKMSSSKNYQLLTIHYPLSTMPVETKEISLNVQNALTDYDFRVENLSIETRLEKSSANNPNNYQGQANPNYNSNYGETALPKVEFEVLDWKNLRINLQLSEQVQKLLGGRRLQFRIRDKERGDSDWYSIKQTFVRMPNIASITCTPAMNGMCEMKGSTIDYISQISIDGGQSWYPQAPATLQVQPTQEGQKLAMIPILPNKKLLMIKLRDFQKGEGLFIGNFSFSNSVKAIKNSTQATPTNKPNQNLYPVQNQTNRAKKKKN